MPNPQQPTIGADVTSLMPPVGADVSHLMSGGRVPYTGDPNRKPVSAEVPHDPSSWSQAFGRAAFGSLAPSVSPEVLDAVGNGVIGILKGLGHTSETLGKAWHLIPGVTRAVDAAYGTPGRSRDAFAAADEATKPEGTAQHLGYGAEQIGEYFIPGAAAERGAVAMTARVAPKLAEAPAIVQTAARIVPRMATEGAASAGVSAAQGGDPVAAGVIGAAAPVVGAVARVAAAKAGASAEKGVEQFLGATKERYKAMAQRLTPQILARGIRGSRDSVMARAASEAETAGQAIDEALQQFGNRQVGVEAVDAALERAKDSFRVTNTAGASVPIEPRALNQLTQLQSTVRKLGPEATVDQLVAVRRAWDDVVAQAGGYAHRAAGAIGMPLRDTTEAWAKREGAGAIRRLLDAEVPELTTLNKEYSFWKGLDDVLTQTTQRTGPQGPGLTRELAGVAGAAAGASHGTAGAAVFMKLSKLANAAFTSPRWRLASAQAKDALANAIMSDQPQAIASALSRILAGATSQMATAGREP